MYMEVASSAGEFEAELLNRYRQSGERLRGPVKNTHVTVLDRIRQEREDARRAETERDEWSRVAIPYEDLQTSVVSPPAPRRVVERLTMREILEEVSKKHGFTVLDLKSQRRERRLVRARHEAMWRCKNETIFSYPRIGKILGGMDHSSVIHGVRMHQKRLEEGIAK